MVVLHHLHLPLIIIMQLSPVLLLPCLLLTLPPPPPPRTSSCAHLWRDDNAVFSALVRVNNDVPLLLCALEVAFLLQLESLVGRLRNGAPGVERDSVGRVQGASTSQGSIAVADASQHQLFFNCCMGQRVLDCIAFLEEGLAKYVEWLRRWGPIPLPYASLDPCTRTWSMVLVNPTTAMACASFAALASLSAPSPSARTIPGSVPTRVKCCICTPAT